jgi:3-methyladenine DNA glycosylase AlkD
MPKNSKRGSSNSKGATARAASPPDVEAVVADLRRRGSRKVRDGMARFVIPSDKAFGISVGTLRQMAKRLGTNHALALELWQAGWYEARMLAVFVADPAQTTAVLMDRWCRDFDNWAICDTACFHLFDRAPHAWRKPPVWARRREEFVRRAAFALLWSLSVHDKRAEDQAFMDGLALIERGAEDDRNFVKKAVNMALRAIGKRNRTLNGAAIATARRLAASSNSTARWVGNDALRELTGPAVARRLAGKNAGIRRRQE